MTQVSEFSLVVGGIAITQGFISPDILGYLSLMALVTMTISTYLITYNEQIYEKVKHLLERFEGKEKKDVDLGTLKDHALVIGYNDTAERIIPTLQEQFEQIAVVDKDPENVRKLEGMNVENVFGDFKHEKIQREVGLRDASLIISFVENETINRKILRSCRNDAVVFIETKDPEKGAEYYDMGADYIIRQNILTVEKMKEYLEDYMESLPKFLNQIDRDKESLEWGGRKTRGEK